MEEMNTTDGNAGTVEEGRQDGQARRTIIVSDELQILREQRGIHGDGTDYWLLETDGGEIPGWVNTDEVTYSQFPCYEKFPRLMTAVFERYGSNVGYRVVTRHEDKWWFRAYTCGCENLEVLR